jgi:hypothetical protein
VDDFFVFGANDFWSNLKKITISIMLPANYDTAQQETVRLILKALARIRFKA